MTHELKCWPEFFWPLKFGRKRFEYREDDRGYQVGDELVIRLWDPHSRVYREDEQPLRFSVTYILDPKDPPFYDHESNYVVLGLDPA